MNERLLKKLEKEFDGTEQDVVRGERTLSEPGKQMKDIWAKHHDPDQREKRKLKFKREKDVINSREDVGL